jgi:hypothetical protein
MEILLWIQTKPGWVCNVMKILGYDEEKEILTVQYNTDVTWEYFPVDEEMYFNIINSESAKKTIKKLLRNPSIVGVFKEES